MVDGSIISRLRRGSVEAFALHGVGVGMLFLMHIVLGRTIEAAGYGIFSYALAIAGVLAIVVPLGWPTALMRFISQYTEQQNWGMLRGAVQRAFQITLFSAIAAALLLWAVSYLPMLSQELTTSLRFAALILPFLSFVGLRRKALQGLQRVKSSIFPEEILMPLLVIVGVYLFAIGNASGALMVYAGAALLVFLLGTILLWRSMPEPGRIAKPEFRTRRWMAVALPMVFGGIGQIIMNRTDVLMLGAMVNMESVGLYSAANRIAMLITFAMTAVSIIAAPMMAAAFHGGRTRQLSIIMHRALLFSGLGALPLFAAIMVAPQLLMGFFGGGFEDADLLLRILGAGQFINAATGPVGFALLMTGHERTFAWTLGSAAAINIAGNLIAIPLYGAVGAAMVTAASVAAMNVSQFILARKQMLTG